MFNVEGTNITLSRGDTGAIVLEVTGYTFADTDRALFSIKNSSGTIVKQQAYQMTDNAFMVTFNNADTDSLDPGGYFWDVRYVIHPYYDERGNIVDGDQVLTPNLPMNVTILTVVGDI